MITRYACCLMLMILCVVGASAQSDRKRLSQSPPRQVLRTAEDIFDDQARGKTPQDVKIIMPAGGGGIVINNVFRTAKRSADDRYLNYVISDEIEYSAGGGHSGFIITAHGNDSALLMTESRFTRLLGITRADACRLDVMEYAILAGGESHYVRSSFSSCSSDEQHKISSIKPRGSSAQRVNLPLYIRPQHRAVLQEWLSNKSGWRPVTLGRNYRPYYTVADFNQDGSEDFAIILVSKSRGSAKYAVAIFNGPFGNNQDMSPAFYTEDVSEGDRLFWMTGDRFGNRLIVGPPDSDASYIIRPRGGSYIIQH